MQNLFHREGSSRNANHAVSFSRSLTHRVLFASSGTLPFLNVSALDLPGGKSLCASAMAYLMDSPSILKSYLVVESCPESQSLKPRNMRVYTNILPEGGAIRPIFFGPD